jgi:Subtilase family
MGGSVKVRSFAAALWAACELCLAASPRITAASEEWRERVSGKLQSVYDARRQAGIRPGDSTAQSPARATTSDGGSRLSAAAVSPDSPARFDTQGRVEADIHYDCAASTPLMAVAAAGLRIMGKASLPPLCVIEGWIAPESLPALATVADITRVTLPSYVKYRPPLSHRITLKSTAQSQAVGAIDGTALTIMHADQFIAQAGGGGGGVLVGVQSQGISSLSTIQARHELPAVKVLTDAAGGSNSQLADEGTALLEEVHAVAPNADLAFCEPQTFVEYTACLQQFANAGAKVMVDDVLFLDQDPMSANGTDTQAIGQFLAGNPDVALFTSGGNDNGSYWEGSYAPVPVSSQNLSPLSCPGSPRVDNFVHQFGAGMSQILTNTTSSAISVPLTFAWADPPGQNASNFDILWTNVADPTQSGCVSAAGSTGTVVTQSIILYPGANSLQVATPDSSLAGKFLKLWVGGDGLTTLSVSTAGSLLTPQTFAPGAITIGAVNGSDGVGNNIEGFSSRGPITVIFPTPARIQAPVLVAPDGIRVDAAGTYFASLLFPDGNFYGTSAAAPNAAAVAALIRGAFPNLTVAQLMSALQAGATQLGVSVPDDTFGYGRIDAMGALSTLPAPTITSLPDISLDASSTTTSPAVPFSISGTGKLHFSVSSTNSTLIPPLLAAPGIAGVAIAPADCGATTLSCALQVTVAQYQGGTATVTVSAVDGAGRSALATVHLMVNNPQPAPPPPSVTASGSAGGGGVLGLWEILVAAALVASRLRRLDARDTTRP